MKKILNNTSRGLWIFLAAVFFLSACNKDIDNNPDNQGTPPDYVTKVSSNIKGFVTNENNEAVNGALVNAGGVSAVTDEYGYFSKIGRAHV